MFAELDYSVQNKNIKQELQDLINQSENPSDENNIAIKSAVEANNVEVVKFLMKDRRVDINLEEDRIIKSLARASKTELTVYLAKDSRMSTNTLANVINIASQANNIDMLDQLLDIDAVLDAGEQYDNQLPENVVKKIKFIKETKKKIERMGIFAAFLD